MIQRNASMLIYAVFLSLFRHIEVTTAPNCHFVFTVKTHHEISRGSVGFSLPQRKWATLSLNQEIEVRPYHFDPTSNMEYLGTIVLEADFLQKKTYGLSHYINLQLRSSVLSHP